MHANVEPFSPRTPYRIPRQCTPFAIGRRFAARPPSPVPPPHQINTIEEVGRRWDAVVRVIPDPAARQTLMAAISGFGAGYVGLGVGER